MDRWKNKEKTDNTPSRWEIAERAKERENRAYDTYTELLIEKLEKVKDDWKKPWFSEGDMPWPKSFYGKWYHGMNALMLSFHCEKQGYRIPVFATSARINELNTRKDKDGLRRPAVDGEGKKLPFVHVLKGEKSFPVFLSNTIVEHKVTGEKIPWEEYTRLDDEEKEDYKTRHNMKVYPVFNIDQTNIKEARPELYQKLVSENLPQEKEIGEDHIFEPLDILVGNSSAFWLCPIKPIWQNQAYYSPKENEIVVPMKEQFIKAGNPESYYGTLLHEMIHSTGHESVLNRLGKEYDPQEYAREELVAELGAALACHRYGMDKVIKEDSLPYLKGWLNNLHEKPGYIRTVLKDVKLATSYVFSRVEAVREVYLDKAAKLDGREDDDASVDIDDEGLQVSEGGNGLLADKKQGEEEGRTGCKEQSEDPQEAQHRRGFHR